LPGSSSFQSSVLETPVLCVKITFTATELSANAASSVALGSWPSRSPRREAASMTRMPAAGEEAVAPSAAVEGP
jgi:hypothetical protein